MAELKQPRATLNSRWRGSYSFLSAVAKIAAHVVGLQERMKGPRYDCYGPWEFQVLHTFTFTFPYGLRRAVSPSGRLQVLTFKSLMIVLWPCSNNISKA